MPSSTLPRTQLHITTCRLPRELGWGWGWGWGTRVSPFSIHRAVSALNSKNLIWINDTKGIDSVLWRSHKPDRPPWNIWERLQPFSVIAQLLSALCAHWSCLRASGCKEKRSYINTHVVFLFPSSKYIEKDRISHRKHLMIIFGRNLLTL